jgi:hypothetical protein|tara:strand:- start:13505 stop:14074 length:570 start_codon:yes stop_codon:yes gene_type:complete
MSKEDLWSTIEADADAFEGLTTEAGKELSGLIRQAGTAERDLKAAEEIVKGARQKRDRYLYDLIPAKMQEMGLDKVEVDGNKVSLSTYVSGTMPKDPLQRDMALQHLRSIGAADFIKNDVSVRFGVSEDNSARAMQADLESQGFDTTAKTWVEPQTLKKLIRERLENDLEIDQELFNAHIGTIAKIKGA